METRMGSIEFRIEVYSHNSNSVSDWSYGCPEFNLMGYINLDELFWDCVSESRKRHIKRTGKSSHTFSKKKISHGSRYETKEESKKIKQEFWGRFSKY